jgi:hypothetical protein
MATAITSRQQVIFIFLGRDEMGREQSQPESNRK